MKFVSRMLPLALVASTFVIASCGGDDDDSDPTPVDTGAPVASGDITPAPTVGEILEQEGAVACALFTQEQIESVTGEPYYPAEEGLGDCIYISKTSAFRNVRVGVSVGPGAAVEMDNYLQIEGVEQVPTSGEKAGWWPLEHRLDVLNGENIYHIAVKSDIEAEVMLATALAEALLAASPTP